MIRKASCLIVFFLIFITPVYSDVGDNNPSAKGIKIIQGPYLQSGTRSSMIIKWRTDEPTSSRVVYGSDFDNLDESIILEENNIKHEVLIDGLKENSKYYYCIGNKEELFIRDDPSYYFITSPDADHSSIVRIWAIGDFGTGDVHAKRVKNGYLKYKRDNHTDVWLMLGDIAYYFGKEEEFQRGVFNDIYTHIMRNTVIWPTPGNHDMRSADSQTQTGPYYDVFTVPTNGEAGGIPSGTEAYYSFDYGNIHFISMDSEDTPREVHGKMAQWLRTDLENDNHTWKIAYFHHPPYTKGTHDSDRDIDSRGRMKHMRENFLPILEEHGVDVVLSGHSHIYERTYLLKGHFGYSTDFDPDQMIVQQGHDKKKNKSAFIKQKNNEGTVYVVCGVSGSRPSHGDCNHPAIAVCRTKYRGSMSIEVRENMLLATFVDEYGRVKDSFTITKDLDGLIE
jgi:hypothetical protein